VPGPAAYTAKVRVLTFRAQARIARVHYCGRRDVQGGGGGGLADRPAGFARRLHLRRRLWPPPGNHVRSWQKSVVVTVACSLTCGAGAVCSWLAGWKHVCMYVCENPPRSASIRRGRKGGKPIAPKIDYVLNNSERGDS
jgi:hypothetical protein